MKKIIGLIACFSIAAIAQSEKFYYEQYQQQPQQEQAQPQYQQQVYEPQPRNVNMDQRDKVQRLIRSGVFRYKDEIQREALYLSPADREALYDRNRKRGGAGWAALDFTVGFGIGSYIQGDIGFGVTQSIMDAVGYVLLLSALNVDTYNYDDDSYNCRYYGECEDESAEITQSILAVSSLAVLVTSRIISWVRPLNFQKRYNRALRSALNNGNSFSYTIDPLIIPRPKNEMPALGLAFNVHY